MTNADYIIFSIFLIFENAHLNIDVFLVIITIIIDT